MRRLVRVEILGLVFSNLKLSFYRSPKRKRFRAVNAADLAINRLLLKLDAGPKCFSSTEFSVNLA
jgi:hypothetical protein